MFTSRFSRLDRFSPRAIVRGAAAVAILAAVVSCGDAASAIDPTLDRVPPTVTLTASTATSETQLLFTAGVRDNIGIKSLSVRAHLGTGLQLAYDTIFREPLTTVDIPLALPVPASVPLGTAVVITARATDGAGNVSGLDTLRLSVGNLPPPSVRITSPATGTIVVKGKSLVISLLGKSPVRVRVVGFQVTGAFSGADSVIFSSPLRDSVEVLDTLALPADAPTGQLILTPFLVDSIGQRTLGPAITLSLQPAGGNVGPPTIAAVFPNSSGRRIETRDDLRLVATSSVGITRFGYQVQRLGNAAVIAGDSAASSGNELNPTRTFRLSLPTPTAYPETVIFTHFAVDANNNRVAVIDTMFVVAGVTRPLPNGGQVADALYHTPTDLLFLTNIERNQLEVFNLDSLGFENPVVVGSRPWGISVWPRNSDGGMGDTLIVANSGGTSLSYVRLNRTNRNQRSEVHRYYLPNIIVYTVTTVLSATTGQPMRQRTVYDFSDRPQYVASVCRTQSGMFNQSSTAPGQSCQEVIVVYSTTPTGGQPLPFPNRGSVRWENLTRRKSHFFFEHATGQTQGRSDTLEIWRFASNGVGSDEPLVLDEYAVGSSRYSVVVDIPRIAFRDTTHVRSSGNFRRAVIGEGGPVLGSRALSYDASAGLRSVLAPQTSDIHWYPIDGGVSRAGDVSDYVANTFARMSGVAINFDGELAAIRADSTYIINPTLRLLGLLQTSRGNAGFDFHPQNAGDGLNTPLQQRLAFAASSEPVIEVYDTYCYRKVFQIPVRDPVIGPIKSSLRPNTGTIILTGATARGVVSVALPGNIPNSCP